MAHTQNRSLEGIRILDLKEHSQRELETGFAGAQALGWTKITGFVLEEGRPALSPDGKWIFFDDSHNKQDTDAPPEIFRVPLK